MNTSELSPIIPATQVVRWRWWIHLLVIGLYTPLLGMLSAGNRANHGPMLTSSSTGLVMVCAFELSLFAFVFWLGWLASRATAKDLMWPWRGGVSVVPMAVGYSILLRISLGVVIGGVVFVLIANGSCTVQELQQFAARHRPKVEKLLDPAAMKKSPTYFWLQVTLVSFVLAGLREEVWRSAVLAGLRKLWPRWFDSTVGGIAAAGIVAVFFALGHLPQGVLAVVVTGLLGFGLGIIMVVHRSIWPAVLAHGMFDATSMALLPWVAEHYRLLPQTSGQ